MIKLIKNADVYAPEHLGLCDILVSENRIAAVEKRIDLPGSPFVEVMDFGGKKTMPGYIDGHVHITGGGGEMGFASRVPECRAADLAANGVTTVLGLLGTDSVSRSLENLLAKARGLEEEGISAYMLTGAYSYPSPVLTRDIMRDVALIDKVIGVKIATSDHRSSALSADEFMRLCAQARVGGIISGKAGLVVVHLGGGRKGFGPLYEALERSDLPIGTLLPTHCGRSQALLQEAVDYAKAGGNIDLTASLPELAAKSGGAARQVAWALGEGVELSRITVSSDAYGSQPVFNEKMECVSITYTRCSVLHDELRRMVEAEGIPLERALLPVTVNVAERLGLRGKKGMLAPGADADLVVWDGGNNISRVLARGREVFRQGESLIRSWDR